jgi:peroxiredoxin
MGIDMYAVLVNRQSALATKEKSGADYEFLYDENLVLTKNMGIYHENAVPVFSDRTAKRMKVDDLPIKDGRVDLPQPAVFLFDTQGKVIWSYVSTNYRVRPDTMDVFVAAETHFGG